MMMIGIAAEDGLGAAAMNVAGPGALPMSVALGGLKAQESELLPSVLHVSEVTSFSFVACDFWCYKAVHIDHYKFAC